MQSEVFPLHPLIQNEAVEEINLNGNIIYEPKTEWLLSFLKEARGLQQELSSTPLSRRLGVLERLRETWLEKLEHGKLDILKRELAKSTGYSETLIGLELEFVGEVLSQDNLRRLLDVSLVGGSRSLEEPVELAPGEYVRNLPAGPVLIIGSGNSVVPPLIPGTISLATGNFTILRPSLTNFRAVREVFQPLQDIPSDEPVRRALLVAYFTHESRNLKTLLEKAPLGVVNYWGGEPGRTVIARTISSNPNRPRLVVNGPMTGFSIIDAEKATDETAEKLALEMVLYDQQLCSSPTQATFIGTRQELQLFAEKLASSLDRIGREYPIKMESLPYHLFVLRRSLELAGAKVIASQDPSNPWTIVLSEEKSLLATLPRNSLLPLYARRRFLEIIRVSSIKEALNLVAELPSNPAYEGVDRVQTLSLAVSREKLQEIMQNIYWTGVYRVVPLGESYLRTPSEPYDGTFIPSAFTFTSYIRVRDQ
jgi:hypothetical protein